MKNGLLQRAARLGSVFNRIAVRQFLRFLIGMLQSVRLKFRPSLRAIVLVRLSRIRVVDNESQSRAWVDCTVDNKGDYPPHFHSVERECPYTNESWVDSSCHERPFLSTKRTVSRGFWC